MCTSTAGAATKAFDRTSLTSGAHEEVARKVMLVSNTTWYIYNFRRGLIRELQKRGYAVIVVSPPDDYEARLTEMGARYLPLSMDNKGKNPWKDLCLWWSLRRTLKAERPSCVLTFTIKPNLYGALAARSLQIPAVSNVSGLGTAFIKQNWVTQVVKGLYRIGLKAAARVFFQNPDDRDYFVREGFVAPKKTQLVPGSGVNTTIFQPLQPSRAAKSGFRFLLLGRLLWDKGIREYVEAAAQIRKRHPDCQFALMGFLGVINATAITPQQIEEWVREGLITYVPAADDVRPEIAKADCVVLPSYREGTPKSLLEAAAMGKPVITTDVPGCRQVVEDGQTGFLVRAKDVRDLAEKMERMINLAPSARSEMGLRGREKMTREFEERIVLDSYLRVIQELT